MNGVTPLRNVLAEAGLGIHPALSPRSRRRASQPHGNCVTHRQYGLSCRGMDALRRDHGDLCALCGASHVWMNIDHDHERGHDAVRGLLCPRCNVGHMRRVDWGERPVDPRTRIYLVNPWYLARHDLALPYEPVIHASVSGLSIDDRAVLRELDKGVASTYAIGRAAPQFEHVGIAACLANADVRPVMRLIWMLRRGLRTADIAAPNPPREEWWA